MRNKAEVISEEEKQNKRNCRTTINKIAKQTKRTTKSIYADIGNQFYVTGETFRAYYKPNDNRVFNEKEWEIINKYVSELIAKSKTNIKLNSKNIINENKIIENSVIKMEAENELLFAIDDRETIVEIEERGKIGKKGRVYFCRRNYKNKDYDIEVFRYNDERYTLRNSWRIDLTHVLTWGYKGGGCLATSYSILDDAFGEKIAEKYYRIFLENVISWQHELPGFSISSDEIYDWIKKYILTGDAYYT